MQFGLNVDWRVSRRHKKLFHVTFNWKHCALKSFQGGWWCIDFITIAALPKLWFSLHMRRFHHQSRVFAHFIRDRRRKNNKTFFSLVVFCLLFFCLSRVRYSSQLKSCDALAVKPTIKMWTDVVKLLCAATFAYFSGSTGGVKQVFPAFIWFLHSATISN